MFRPIKPSPDGEDGAVQETKAHVPAIVMLSEFIKIDPGRRAADPESTAKVARMRDDPPAPAQPAG